MLEFAISGLNLLKIPWLAAGQGKLQSTHCHLGAIVPTTNSQTRDAVLELTHILGFKNRSIFC